MLWGGEKLGWLRGSLKITSHYLLVVASQDLLLGWGLAHNYEVLARISVG